MRTDCQGHSDAVGVATPPLNMSHPKTSKDYTMARGVGVYGLKKTENIFVISILFLLSQSYGGRLPAIESE